MTSAGLSLKDLDTPSLWVDLSLMEANISALVQHFRSAGVDWRPHTKGIKVPAIAHKAIAAGAIGVTCAKLSEAEVMAAAGIRDILVANQIVGRQKIERLVNLQRHADIIVAVDNAENVQEIGRAAHKKGVEVGVLVDVNNGMDRTGVDPGAPAVELSRLAHGTEGIRYLGLMAYEGHTIDIIGEPDKKRAAIEKAIGMLADTVDQCRAQGLPVDIVSGGGSGTYKITPFLRSVTEMQAGGAIFCDVAYRSWDVETDPSIFVQVTVTSRPTPTRIITDAGWKALPLRRLGMVGTADVDRRETAQKPH